MQTETIEVHADGARLVCRCYVDDARPGRRPGVLVAPEAFGLSAHAYDVAHRLAEAGYAALALDYYGDAAYLDMATCMPRVGAFMAAPDTLRARAAAGLAALAAQPLTDPTRLAAIGYCFGGTTALELARSGADLKAVVGFHSGLTAPRPADAKAIRAKVLVCIGAADPVIPPAQRAAFETEMTDAGVDWRMILYGGVGHSFTTPEVGALGNPAFAYDASADHRSWRAMVDLFDEAFGPPQDAIPGAG